MSQFTTASQAFSREHRSNASARRAATWSLLTILLGFSIFALRSPAREDPLEKNAEAGTYSLDFENQNIERTAIVHVPRGYDPARKPPLVLVLHGAGGSGEHVIDNDQWKATSEAGGFVLVAPDGVPARADAEANFLTNPRLWNSGQLRARAPRARIDDVAYIKQLLDEVEERVAFDRKRVFVVGHSNGAGMSFRLANEMSDQITAIAAMAGEVVENPRLSRPVPTLAIFGVDDEVRPLAGGESELPWGTRTTQPVADELRDWAQALGCQSTPELVSDEDGVRKEVYRSQAQNSQAQTAENQTTENHSAELNVIYLSGHGHAWPQGRRGVLMRRALGPTHPSFKANETIWEFFESCPSLP